MVSRKNKLIGAGGMAVLAYLAGAADPYTTTDYQVYFNHYNIMGLEASPFEKGYTQLAMLFLNHGMSYAQFRVFFSFLAFLIMYLGVIQFTSNVALYTGLYGVTFFCNDATQIRNLMMISLVLLGAGLLIKPNKYLKLMGIFVFLISTQFHDLGFIFLLIIPLTLIPGAKLKRLIKPLVSLLVLLAGIIVILGKSRIANLMSLFLGKFSSRVDSTTSVTSHFARGISKSSAIEVIVVVLSMVLLAWLFSRIFTIKLKQDIVFYTKFKVLTIGLSISLLTIILIFMSPDYSRISRNASLFMLVLLSLLTEKSEIRLSKNSLASVMIVSIVLFCNTFVNSTIWGSTYTDSIPYILQIKKS